MCTRPLKIWAVCLVMASGLWLTGAPVSSSAGGRLEQQAVSVSVPLLLRDVQGAGGVDRNDDPVTSGVPLPQAAGITDPAALRILDPDGQAIPAQFTVLARWGGAPDDATKPIRWVLADFRASVAASAEVTYTLDNGDGGLADVLDPAPLAPPGITLPGEAASGRISESTNQSAGESRITLYAPRTTTAISLTETADLFLIDTGPARFRILKQGFNLFDQVWMDRDRDGQADDPLLEASDGPVISAGGNAYRAAWGPVDEAAVELMGPLHTIIRVRGRHANAAGQPLLAYTARLHFYAGQSSVRVFYGVWNDRPLVNDGSGQPEIKAFGSPNSIQFDDLTIGMTLDVTDDLTYILDDWSGALTGPAAEAVLYQDSSGGPQWNHPSIATETTFRGYAAQANGITLHGSCDESAAAANCRALGWAGLAATDGGLMVGIRHFWQNYPDRLRAGADGRVLVQPFPAEYAASYELRVGERKTHELLFYFHTGASAETVAGQMRRLTTPLRAWAPAAWYADSGALGDLVPYDPAAFAAYEGYNDAAIDYPAMNFDILHEGVGPSNWLYLPRPEQWGWRNFGDTVAEDEMSSNWPPLFHNGQYDHPYYFLTQGIRTLDAPPAADGLARWQHWWSLAEASARHQADIDTVHGYCTGIAADLMSDPLCLDATQGPPYGVGWAWGARLTNQWHSDPSTDIHRHALLDYWSGGIRGLTWYYYLTGEGEARDGWLEIAENARWRLENSPCDPDCGPGYSHNNPVDNDARGPAYALEIMADAYAATGDAAYLAQARDVISDSLPGKLFFGQPGFAGDFNKAPAGASLRIPFTALMVKSGGYYLETLAASGLSDPTAVTWLHDYGALLASAWEPGAADPLCITVGENGGCTMDSGDIDSLLFVDGLTAALQQGNPTPPERAAWEAIAAEAWRIGSEHPWGSYAPATFMSAKSQVLYGVSGQPFMRYALAQRSAAESALSALAVSSHGRDLSLTWPDEGLFTAYQVWRHSAPYFTAGSPPATLIADDQSLECTSNGGTVTCKDLAALGSPFINYFYVVRGHTTLGVWVESGEKGAFNFGLAPGTGLPGSR